MRIRYIAPMAMMQNKNIFRGVAILVALFIISIILWNTYTFFQQLKEEERIKMNYFATAQRDIQQISDPNANLGELPILVIETNNSTPFLMVQEDGGGYSPRNMSDTLQLKDETYRMMVVDRFKEQNEPIKVIADGVHTATIYYGDSPILTRLKYYPAGLILIILLFSAGAYFYYRSTKSSEQNKLWAGMAKETAHQIGTPLSSLIGWATILRDTDAPSEYIDEMEKDVYRLQTIADRFGKIGSVPELKKEDIVDTTRSIVSYLESRSSKLVTFTYDFPDEVIEIPLSGPLYGWVIENLVKNGIDAMKGKGAMHVSLVGSKKEVRIRIKDTGKGIAKEKWKRVFEPGYTTKKRGWGLGLSLAKRIIKDYHKGRIYIAESVYQGGTTFEIVLPLG